jgi:phosphoglycolate phosphatase
MPRKVEGVFLTKEIFRTERVSVEAPQQSDASFFISLWSDSRVMSFVGFPGGLSCDEEQTALRMAHDNERGKVFGRPLLVRLTDGNRRAGECFMSLPDEEGLSETDVKLHPRFWGEGYGTEIKKGLIEYIFSHTEARGVKATPNINNKASIRMQEKCGGVCLGEGLYSPDPKQQKEQGACDVPFRLYVTYREEEKKGKAVIFDLDGTLLDTLGDITDAVNHATGPVQKEPYTTEEVRHMVGRGLEVLLEKAASRALQPEEKAELIALFNKAYSKNWDRKTRPYDGIPELLARIREAGYTMGVLSNKPHEFTVKCVKKFFPDIPFRVIRGVRDEGLVKPDPLLTGHVLRLLGADPGQTLFLGDSEIDIRAAKACSLFSGAALWGFRTEAELVSEHPDALFAAPQDVAVQLFDKSSPVS